ncbi:hypothetical protein MBLNU459_g7024t1 [Dothideomycetes sp. NU459]
MDMEQQQSPPAPPPPLPAPLDASTAAQTTHTAEQHPPQPLSQDHPLLPPIQQLANHLQQAQAHDQGGPAQVSAPDMNPMHHPQQPLQQQQQQQPQHYHQHAQHATPPLQQHQYELPPPTHNGAPPMQHQQPSTPVHYTYPPAAQPLNGDANGYPPQMRYSMPLPPNQMDARQMSGGRHKKEIKRRTKTGCLTCRKRRIKCDEGHPTCRNCQKSKRECLGYDPIFKSQGVPASIQPAPGSVPPPMKAEPSQLPVQPPPPPQNHAPYSNVPAGYAPAASAGYSPAPPLPHTMDQPYDYANAIDPALAAANSAAAPPPPQPPMPEEYTTELNPDRRVSSFTMSDLFRIDDVKPTSPPPRDVNSQPFYSTQIEEVRNMFTIDYAPGLDRFFETSWYSTQGLQVLLADKDLLNFCIHCVDRFRRAASEPSQQRGIYSLEAKLVWQLACLARTAEADVAAHPSNHIAPDLQAVLQRVTIVQHLLCASYLDEANIPAHPQHAPPDLKTAPDQYAQWIQDSFWHHLALFLTIHDDDYSNSADQIASTLTAMRNILSMLENRDVSYSMAIARHFGGRMQHYFPDKILVSNNPTDPDDSINKLSIAMRFLADEDGGGTTQVVQRFCSMARRSWLLQRPRDIMPPADAQIS